MSTRLIVLKHRLSKDPLGFWLVFCKLPLVFSQTSRGTNITFYRLIPNGLRLNSQVQLVTPGTGQLIRDSLAGRRLRATNRS
jgi:hypothetical protein